MPESDVRSVAFAVTTMWYRAGWCNECTMGFAYVSIQITVIAVGLLRLQLLLLVISECVPLLGLKSPFRMTSLSPPCYALAQEENVAATLRFILVFAHGDFCDVLIG